MNRKDRDRGVEMRLTERTRKLIPERRWGTLKEAISYRPYVARMMLVVRWRSAPDAEINHVSISAA